MVPPRRVSPSFSRAQFKPRAKPNPCLGPRERICAISPALSIVVIVVLRPSALYTFIRPQDATKTIHHQWMTRGPSSVLPPFSPEFAPEFFSSLPISLTIRVLRIACDLPFPSRSQSFSDLGTIHALSGRLASIEEHLPWWFKINIYLDI